MKQPISGQDSTCHLDRRYGAKRNIAGRGLLYITLILN
jgi:hypothetical protein